MWLDRWITTLVYLSGAQKQVSAGILQYKQLINSVNGTVGTNTLIKLKQSKKFLN